MRKKYRKEYHDIYCDRCRVNLKINDQILCKECTDLWITHGLKIINVDKVAVTTQMFDDWFLSKPEIKRKTFIFR